MNPWFLYLIRASSGELYTGITTDVERRFAEHQAGKGAKYLRGKGPLTLVFSACIGNRSQATKVERALKLRPKRLKEDLVSGLIPLNSLIPAEIADVERKSSVVDAEVRLES